MTRFCTVLLFVYQSHCIIITDNITNVIRVLRDRRDRSRLPTAILVRRSRVPPIAYQNGSSHPILRHPVLVSFPRVINETGAAEAFFGRVSHLNVQSAYKRQNTGTGKSHFLHFLEVARQDALIKWRPNHEPPCLRDCHTFYKVFTVQTSCSGFNTIVTLTETLLWLRGRRETQLHRSRPYGCSGG